MGNNFLDTLMAVLAVALPTVYLLHKLKLPTMVGFIVAGVLIGPGGLALIDDREAVFQLAEVGVMLLLFSIGLKFSTREFKRMGRLVVGAGVLQVVLTSGLTSLLALLAGLPMLQAWFLGTLVAMSSTVIVLKLLEESAATDSAAGRLMIGTLIFQDLAAVPLMLLIPVLGSPEGQALSSIGWALGKSVMVLAVILLIARYVYPWLLEQSVHTRSREVFTLTTVLVAFGTAYLTARLGYSLAIGAFLAGLIIADSEYSQQILAEITPLRDGLSSLFFVSIGMLVLPSAWLAAPLQTLGATVVFVLLKFIVMVGVAYIVMGNLRIAIVAALGLAQIGEFSFILAVAGMHHGLLDDGMYQSFLSFSVLSMVATPFLLKLGMRLPHFSQAFTASGDSADEHEDKALEHHVIIVGYGVSGSNVAKVLRSIKVKYRIVELNPLSVKRARAAGESIIYGDAGQSNVLNKLQVMSARVLVVAVADPIAARQIVSNARRLNPKLITVVRTRYIVEVQPLFALGADEVICEELETSLELAGLVMAAYGADGRTIQQEKHDIRHEGYSGFKR